MSRSSVPCGKSNRSEPMPSFPLGFDMSKPIAALVEVQEGSHTGVKRRRSSVVARGRSWCALTELVNRSGVTQEWRSTTPSKDTPAAVVLLLPRNRWRSAPPAAGASDHTAYVRRVAVHRFRPSVATGPHPRGVWHRRCERGAQRLLVVAVLSSVVDTPVAAHQATPHENWVQRSDAFAAMVVKVDRGMHPESGAADPAFDDQVTDFSVSARQRARAAYRRLLDTLRAERSRERDLDVRQDLNVLVDLVDGRVHAIDVEDRYELPYLVPARVALQGINALSDPQIPPERQRHALVRLRKYSGLEPGSTPLTVVARERISAALRRPDLATPARADIEQ